jgi:hypothetical protein
MARKAPDDKGSRDDERIMTSVSRLGGRDEVSICCLCSRDKQIDVKSWSDAIGG